MKDISCRLDSHDVYYLLCVELQLMFRLIDRVPGGIDPMLTYLEEHITNTGLADMIAAANIITQVRLSWSFVELFHIL